MSDYSKFIVMDSGSGTIKMGHAGANFPTTVFPTVLGHPILRAGKEQQRFAAAAAAAAGSGDKKYNAELKEEMYGDETAGVRHLLQTTFPVKNGIILDWDAIEKLWSYGFTQKLKINPKDGGYRVSFSEPALSNERLRKKTVELLFEKFGFDYLQGSGGGILTLYSEGLTTGVAVDVGDNIAHCTPIYEGYGLPTGVKQIFVGGRHVTEYLVRLLQRRGYSFTSSADFETVNRIKEMFCFSASDIVKEKKLADETTVLETSMMLPDGSKCTIGAERFQAPEILFDRSLTGDEGPGVSDMVWNSLQAVSVDLRPSLYRNIVLSGGSSMFPGFPTRLENDLTNTWIRIGRGGDASAKRQFTNQLKILDAPRRKHNVFLGAACFAEMTAEDDSSWLSKAVWEEEGDKAIKNYFQA